MKKKVLGILMIGVIAMALTGCGGSTKDSSTAKSNKEYEIEIMNKNDAIGELERYDSCKLYYEDAEISYSVPSRYKSEKKQASSGHITETFNYTNDDNDKIRLTVGSTNYDYYSKLVDSKDLGEGLLQEILKIEGLAAQAFEGKDKSFDVKNIKVGDYNVYYAEFKANDLGYEESVTTNIYLTFNVVENYTVEMRLSTFNYNKDSSEVSIETLKPIIESFKATLK